MTQEQIIMNCKRKIYEKLCVIKEASCSFSSALNSFIFRKNVYTVLLRPKLNINVFGHFTEGLALFTQSVLSLPIHIKQSQYLCNTLQPDSWYLCTNVIGRRAPPGVMFITNALSP